MEVNRRSFLAGIAATAAITACANSPISPYKDRRRRFVRGTSVTPTQLEDVTLRPLIAECDILVPEYHGQWQAVEWNEGTIYTGNIDQIVAFARDHGQMVRGHSLIWEQMTPDWARYQMLRDRNWATVERHFASAMTPHIGKIDEWVVVNEMIDTKMGFGYWRQNSFFQAYGPSYIDNALHLARSIDPATRLMINEYGLEHDNEEEEARRRSLVDMVRRLKDNGVPLDMVGIQGHLELAKPLVSAERLNKLFDDLASAGVTLAITEFDVLEDPADLDKPEVERDMKVANAAHEFLKIASLHPAMTSITTWGLTDKDSWLRERQIANRGLPYDSTMRPKPLAHIVRQATDILA